MRIAPIPEMASLRRTAGSSSSSSKLAGGTQVEVRLSCAASAPSGGAVGVDVLVSANGKQHTRVSYDYARE